MYDPNLGQEVIVYNTPLRKQIFVDPGIRVNRFTADADEINTAGGGTSGPGSKFIHLISRKKTIFKNPHQWAARKLKKSSLIFFLTKLHFLKFQNWPKINF